MKARDAVDESRVRDVLESFFLAAEEGRELQLDELCAGDAALYERVRGLLATEPAAVRRLGEPEVALEPDASLPQLRLADFVLLERLGRGGMGAVYVARQSSLGRRVALKLLDAGAMGDARAKERFRREAALAASLDHPGIVPVFAIGEEEGHAFIAMKLLSGPSLAELERPLDAREAARIGITVALALDEAHLSGVVHRDVKPANVLLDGDRPYVVDFGLARAQGDVTLTREGAVPGTLQYLAPELLAGTSRGLDPRVDVYALGATLYEVTSGRPPFQADTVERLVSRILFEDPRPLRLGAAARDFETIVMRALEKEPERRVQTAAELADELQRFLDGRPIRSRPTGVFGRTYRLARRHRRTAAAFGSFLGITLALAVALGVRSVRERRALAHDLAAIERSLASDDLAAAGVVLDQLLDRHPRDERVVELAAEHAARVAVEDLLQAVSERPLGLIREELEACVAAVDERRAPAHSPGVRSIALAVATHHLGRDDEAREHLERAREDADCAAACDLVDGWLDGDAPAAPAAGVPAELCVLFSAALRLSGADLEAQRPWWEAALRLEPANQRARFARAIALLDGGRAREAARMLEDLVQRDSTPRSVWRNLARARLVLGDVNGAREAIARIPEPQRRPLDDYYWLATVLRLDVPEVFDRELQRLAELHGESPILLQLEAERLSRPPTFDRAVALLDRVLELERDPVQRELGLALRFKTRVDRADALLLPSDGRVFASEEAAGEYFTLLGTGEELLATVDAARARGVVSWMMARCALFVGDIRYALELFDDALRSLPSEFGVHHDAIVLVAYAALQLDQIRPDLASDAMAEAQQYALSLVRERLDALFALLEARELAQPPEGGWQRIEWAAAQCAAAQSDYRFGSEQLSNVLRREPPTWGGRPGFEAHEEAARRGRAAFLGE